MDEPEPIDDVRLDETETPGEVAAEQPDFETLPLVPLRDNVVVPLQMAPLAAGRPRSVAALEEAVAGDGRVVLAVQRDASVDDVELDDLWPVAVVSTVGAFRRLPVSGVQALVEGQGRVRIRRLIAGEAWRAEVEIVGVDLPVGAEAEALASSVRTLFGDYVGAGGPVLPDVAVAMARSTTPSSISDLASAAPDLSPDERVALLQETDILARLRLLVRQLARLVEVAQLRTKIQEDVQRTMNKGQREHILREQLRVTRRELADLEGGDDDDVDLGGRIEKMAIPEAVKKRLLKEAARLEQIPSASPEMGMVRTWIDWILDLPWGDPAPENLDIEHARSILDEDHYGLPKVKDRILEWLAVRQRTRERFERQRAQVEAAAEGDGEPDKAVVPPRPVVVLQTPILCLVGPPGVGKTSLGKSVARALDRKFVRMSLGGIRDEAEIRGHRRTYIGALPGRIIQSMRQAGTRNPVIMLDEIDKVGTDFRGDPSAALLEVLDPEQNFGFSDHYIEVPYDLSEVLFVTTANVAETISPPLRDRMEVIRINGYTDAEKLGIATQHLVPRQLDQHGLEAAELNITDDALRACLHGYTREAGVRQLNRTIAEIARKVPRKLALGTPPPVVVTALDLVEYLGPQRFESGEAHVVDEIGTVTGVVVSEVGGDVITVEALAIEGRNDLVLTGQIGNVMEESAQAALSWAKVHAGRYGAPRSFFDTHGVHIHVPAGAIPKDGPSAGITLATALVSVASSRAVRRDVAMTGEVTLRGNVLPIGGLKDKLLAAHRAGIATFILPRKNVRDLHEVDKEILDAIEIVAVDTVNEVLDVALVPAETNRTQRRVGFMLPLPPEPPATLH